MVRSTVLIIIVSIVSQVCAVSITQKGIFGKAIAKINEGDALAQSDAKARVIKHIENMEKAQR